MQIKIKQKFTLISHKIGSSFLIKNSKFFVTIFPALLLFNDLDSKKTFKVFFNFQGPQKRFTILHDLKNGELKIFFDAPCGFFSFKIKLDGNNLNLFFENLPNNEIEVSFENDINFKKVPIKEKLLLPIDQITNPKIEEQISLGVYKKQDIELIRRREDLVEILPFIFMLSQYYSGNKQTAGKNNLIENIKNNIQNNEKNLLEESFLNVYKALFFDAFVPRIRDEEHQNINNFNQDNNNIFPLGIFNLLYEIIKSLFILQNSDGLYLLPCLLISMHHGKAINLKTSFGLVDLEWSKKILKKAIIRPNVTVKIKINLQSKIKNFRLKIDVQGKGVIYQNNDEILLEKHKIYYLDNFKK